MFSNKINLSIRKRETGNILKIVQTAVGESRTYQTRYSNYKMY